MQVKKQPQHGLLADGGVLGSEVENVAHHHDAGGSLPDLGHLYPVTASKATHIITRRAKLPSTSMGAKEGGRAKDAAVIDVNTHDTSTTGNIRENGRPHRGNTTPRPRGPPQRVEGVARLSHTVVGKANIHVTETAHDADGKKIVVRVGRTIRATARKVRQAQAKQERVLGKVEEAAMGRVNVEENRKDGLTRKSHHGRVKGINVAAKVRAKDPAMHSTGKGLGIRAIDAKPTPM